MLDPAKGATTPIDLLFLDGWKDLYLLVLELVRPRLGSGAVIVADNVNLRDAQPYLDRVREPAGGFACATLFGGSMELSYLGTSLA